MTGGAGCDNHIPENVNANCATTAAMHPTFPKAFFITSWYEKHPTEMPTDNKMYNVYSVTKATSTNMTTPVLSPASLIAAGTAMIVSAMRLFIKLKDAPIMPLPFLWLLGLGSAGCGSEGLLEAWKSECFKLKINLWGFCANAKLNYSLLTFSCC